MGTECEKRYLQKLDAETLCMKILLFGADGQVG